MGSVGKDGDLPLLKCKVPPAFNLSLEGGAFRRLERIDAVVAFLACEALLNSVSYFLPVEARLERAEDDLRSGHLMLGIIGLHEANPRISNGRHRLLALRLAGRTSVPFLTDRSMVEGLQQLFGRGSDQHLYDLSDCEFDVL